MYISRRGAKLRNALVSIFNGSVTLVILLIAPLGLMAVIINTVLVTLGTYVVSNVADRVITALEPEQNAELTGSSREKNRHLGKSALQRWWR
ncbi:MAG: CRISPR-associated protein Csx18 [Nostoc sp.]|uniref:CRISPR-associated protein Csx18 n=1 Tax=Nostoc sp. TaxID=1180 RepID=UPI002FF8CA59